MNPTRPHSENLPSPPITKAATAIAGQQGTQTSLSNIVGVSSGGTNATTTSSNNSGCKLLPTIRSLASISSAEKPPATTPGQSKSTTLPASASADAKRVIRTIRPIDLSKLQQTGLDRKIAEVLSKQKQGSNVKRLANEVKHLSKASSSNAPQKLYKVLKPPAALVTATSTVGAIVSQSPTTSSQYQATFTTYTKLVATAPSSSSPSVTLKPSSPTVTATKSFPNRPIIPPKITITAPEVCNEGEGNVLSDLTPEQRMKHVKGLLHKKLLQKQKQVSPISKDGKKLHIHLKPPSSPTLSPQERLKSTANVPSSGKLPTMGDRVKHLMPPLEDRTIRNSPSTANNKEPNKMRAIDAEPKQDALPGTIYCKAGGKTYAIHKDVTSLVSVKAVPKTSHSTSADVGLPTSEYVEKTPPHKLPTKPVTSKKSPQDIARKLDFQFEERPMGVLQTGTGTGSISTTGTTTNVTTVFVHDALSNKVTGFAGLPKSCIKVAHSTPPPNKHVTIAKQRIVIPDVSPLKTPFPTSNVPLETPLPTIDTFKKPYPMISDSSYFTLIPQNQQHLAYTGVPSTCYQNPQYLTATAASLQINPSAAHGAYSIASPCDVTATSNSNVAPNSLIVLENKVLSQDEMIDLTALRLSKFDSPQRFARPHKPIPEVVIKQEKPDDFSPTLICSSEFTDDRSIPTAVDEKATKLKTNNDEDCIKGTDLVNGKETQRLIMISSKQNKKFIVNAQKLKLPPEKIADLAKKIAEQTARDKNSNKRVTNITPIRPQAFKPIVQCPSSRQLTGNDIVIPEIASRKGGKLYILPQADVKHVPNKPVAQQILKYGHTNSAFKKITGKFTAKEELNTSDTLVRKANNLDKPASSSSKDHNIQDVKKEETYEFSKKNRKPAVEILDEPATEDSFSAVDFLATFACSNAATEATQLELTPDELNLNASCSINFSPPRMRSFSPRKTKVSSSTSQQDRPVDQENVSTQSGTHKIVSGSEKGNVIETQSVPMNVPAHLVHDILYSKAPGFATIPKASIRQAQIAAAMKQSIIAQNDDAIPTTVDTIIIESSRGRDHLLRKSLDHRPTKKVVTIPNEVPNATNVRTSREALERSKSPKMFAETEYSSKLSENILKCVSDTETNSNTCGDILNPSPKYKEMALKDTVVSAAATNVESARNANETKDEFEKDLPDLKHIKKTSNEVIPASDKTNKWTSANIGKNLQGNSQNTKLQSDTTTIIEKNLQDHNQIIKLPTNEATLSTQSTFAGTKTSNEEDNAISQPSSIILDHEHIKLLEGENINQTKQDMSNKEEVKQNVTAIAEEKLEDTNCDIAPTTETPLVPFETQIEPKIVDLEASESCSNLKSILKPITPAENKDKLPVAPNMNATGSNPAAPPPSKRISRFKKGKINLVQRNKPSAAARKQTENSATKTNDTSAKIVETLTQQQSDNSNHKSTDQASSSVSSLEATQPNDKEINSAEMQLVLDNETQTGNLQIAEIPKEDHNTNNESNGSCMKTLASTPDVEEDVNTTGSSKHDNLQGHSTMKENDIEKKIPDSANEGNENSTLTIDNNERTLKIPNLDAGTVNDVGAVPEESPLDTNFKTNNEQLHTDLKNSSNSTICERGTSPGMFTSASTSNTLGFENFPSTSLTPNEPQENKHKDEQILKVTVTSTADGKDNIHSSPGHSYSPASQQFLNMSQSKNEHEQISGVTAAAQSNDLTQQQRKEIVDSSSFSISHLINSPNIIESVSNVVKSNDTLKESTANDSNRKPATVSLADIVKYSSPEARLTPPQIPFKRKCLETTPKKSERIIGIKNLLSKIKGNDGDVEETGKESTGHQDREKKVDEYKETNSLVHDIQESEAVSHVKEDLPQTEHISKSESDDKSNNNAITQKLIIASEFETAGSKAESESKTENNPNDNAVTGESKETNFISPKRSRRFTRVGLVDDDNKQSKDKAKDSPNRTPNKRQKCSAGLKPTDQKDLNEPKRRKPFLTECNEEKNMIQLPLGETKMLETETLCILKEMNSTATDTEGVKNVNDPMMKSLTSDEMNNEQLNHTIESENCLDSKSPTKLVSSCQDNYSQGFKTLHSRKRLRKTVDHNKKSQIPSDTDSEDGHDFGTMNGFCEAADSFLGFEDNSMGFSRSRKLHGEESSEDEKGPQNSTTTKGGTLKNWLTTGKAISPTSTKDGSPKRLRHGINKKQTVIRGGIPLKKRWDLSMKFQEETDVTDDTSPVDDEDEEMVAPSKKTEHCLKSVIDNSKTSKDTMNIVKDNEATSHTFVEPTPMDRRERTSETDSDAPISTSVRRLKRARRLLSDDFEETEDIENVQNVPFNCSVNLREPQLVKSTEIQNSGEALTTENLTVVKKAKFNIDQEAKKLTAENVKNISEKSSEILCPSTEEKAKEDQDTDKQQTSKRIPKVESRTKLNMPNVEKQVIQDKNEEEVPGKAIKRNRRVGKDIIDKTSANTPRKSKTDMPKKDSKVAALNIPQVCEDTKSPTIKPTIEVSTTNMSTKRRGRPRKSQNVELNREANIETPKTTSPASGSLKLRGRQKSETPSEKRCNHPLLLIKNPEQINTGKTLEEIKFATGVITPNAVTPGNSALSGDITSPTVGTSTEITTAKRRGRQSVGSSQTARFNPRLLLIRKREQLETDESLVEAKPGNGSIQCGLCMAKTTQSKWHLHLATHYGIGWKQGEEKLNIENRAAVLNSIISFLRDTEIKVINCRMCDKSYRSGLGMLSHIESCGAEVQRPLCEYCHKDYAILSLPIHVRTCPERMKLLCSEVEKPVVITAEPVFSTTGRAKRVSTLKAESRLKTLGAELVKTVDDDFNPKSHIKYTPPLGSDVRTKWSTDISNNGKAVCPFISCRFSSDSVDVLEQHITECKFTKKPGYYCEFCKELCFATKQKAIEHVIKSHSPAKDFSDDSDCNIKTDEEQSSNDEDGVSEEVDEDELEALESSKNNSSKTKGKSTATTSRQSSNTNTSQIVLRKKVFDKRTLNISQIVKRKWKNFLKLNYSPNILFENSKSQYTILKTQQYTKHLPPQDISMKFFLRSKAKLNSDIGVPENDIEWSQIERFNTINFQNETFCFIGAPITWCSWLPLPSDVEEQYLLVAYRKDMFKFVKFLNPKHFKTTLLLFKITKTESSNKIPEIRLHYGITIDDGPVHQFDFLPSGGYNLKDNRLALVAVASVLPTIKVYSLPIDISEGCDTGENIPLIALIPSFELRLGILQEDKTEHIVTNPQCLKIAWSEFSGHNHIFAGYSNGFIGIWDITDDPQENLNRFEIENVVSYVPLNYFYVGEKAIKCIALHYDTTGPRWLAVAGCYRRLVVYDIRNMTEPIALKEECNRNIMRCMDWCPLWEPFLSGFCDSIPNNGRCIQCINPSNVTYNQQKLDTVVSAVTSVHYTPYYNMCVASVDNGDLLFMDTREIHYEHALDKKFGERRILASMDVKQLDGQPIPRLVGAKSFKGKKSSTNINGQNLQKLETEWIMYDADYKKKYGLVFQPVLKLRDSLKTTYFSEKRRAPLNIVPYTRINTLKCNLNDGGKRLIAVGYENGFLRVMYFDKNNHFCRW